MTTVPIVLDLDPAVDPTSVSRLWNEVEVRPATVTPGTMIRLNLPLPPGRDLFLASASGVIGRALEGRPGSARLDAMRRSQRLGAGVAELAERLAILDHRPVVDHDKPDPHGRCQQ